GRAQPCQGWGRGFKSRLPLHMIFSISLSARAMRFFYALRTMNQKQEKGATFSAVRGISLPPAAEYNKVMIFFDGNF
ncbi:MAG: hypothetical protein SOZ52_01985, partial [Pyramidobacter sp.]|nr:hypothetical protein [Pyramidobacter sp.]